ncbi:MAG: alpha-L-arabinofuranosidase C-terminal domain-containing protein [Breznakibacter sp.]
MKLNPKQILLWPCMVATVFCAVAQREVTAGLQADKPLYDVSPHMWGLFFEDINFAADGGLSAQLLKNRSFEFIKPMMGWREIKTDGGNGRFLVINRGEGFEKNPRVLRLITTSNKGRYGISNDGFRGMGVKEGITYHFSVMAALHAGDVSMRIELVAADGKLLGQATVPSIGGDWKKYEVSFTSSGTDAKAKLNIWLEGDGELDIDLVSLYPSDTWKNRPNGFRSDLVQRLADINPGFLRFPGGCIVEGHELATRYQWKKTVGPVEERPLAINRWNTEFPRRSAPDYFQSFEVGFYEYFLLSEDIGAEPLPILNCGMACQYNTGEVVPMSDLEPYIQDMLDLIEFANGPANSQWGKVRADMGHPAPFDLKYLGIGNEQWGPQYIERYEYIAGRIREKYPEIKLIGSSGPSPDGTQFDYLWHENRRMGTELVDFVDEHYYKDPDWFLRNASRYDSYDRNAPKVFAGEYACHGKEGDAPESRNHWWSALCEAAFMTGLERNADVVRLASYAPLFAHVEAWQWRPDMIWFDNLTSVATPNYHVQKMYGTHRGTHVVPLLGQGKPLAGNDSIYASAVIDKQEKCIYVKVANVALSPVKFSVNIKGASCKSPASYQKMESPDREVFNGIGHPTDIVPQQGQIKLKGSKLLLEMEPQSFYVVKINCGRL